MDELNTKSRTILAENLLGAAKDAAEVLFPAGRSSVITAYAVRLAYD